MGGAGVGVQRACVHAEITVLVGAGDGAQESMHAWGACTQPPSYHPTYRPLLSQYLLICVSTWQCQITLYLEQDNLDLSTSACQICDLSR